MDAYQQIIATIALMMGTAWASGINLYATIAMLGILGSTGNIVLPQQLVILQDPLIIGAASIMYCVEFFADKTPGVDTGWDVLHSFIRIPAGVMLAAGAVGEVNPALVIAAGILGGTVSATSHVIKAGSRVLINTSPEPFSNWAASFSEDLAVIGGLWLALHSPLLFLGLFFLFIVLAILLIPRIWAGIRTIMRKLANLFSQGQRQERAPVGPGQSAFRPLRSRPESGGQRHRHRPASPSRYAKALRDQARGASVPAASSFRYRASVCSHIASVVKHSLTRRLPCSP